jgi:hypothetical protein
MWQGLCWLGGYAFSTWLAGCKWVMFHCQDWLPDGISYIFHVSSTVPYHSNYGLHIQYWLQSVTSLQSIWYMHSHLFCYDIYIWSLHIGTFLVSYVSFLYFYTGLSKMNRWTVTVNPKASSIARGSCLRCIKSCIYPPAAHWMAGLRSGGGVLSQGKATRGVYVQTNPHCWLTLSQFECGYVTGPHFNVAFPNFDVSCDFFCSCHCSCCCCCCCFRYTSPTYIWSNCTDMESKLSQLLGSYMPILPTPVRNPGHCLNVRLRTTWESYITCLSGQALVENYLPYVYVQWFSLDPGSSHFNVRASPTLSFDKGGECQLLALPPQWECMLALDPRLHSTGYRASFSKMEQMYSIIFVCHKWMYNV